VFISFETVRAHGATFPSRALKPAVSGVTSLTAGDCPAACRAAPATALRPDHGHVHGFAGAVSPQTYQRLRMPPAERAMLKVPAIHLER